jgi:RNA polymerase sigma-70 factor (ECF subfamily)
MANESDRLLVESIRQRDPDAWRQLIDRYEGRLRAFLHRRIKNPDTCDDLVQETFIGFLNSLPHYDDKRELQTYLFTIASYKLTDHLRKLGRHPVQQATEDASGNDPLLQRADSSPAASSVARSRERQDLEEDAVARCLGALLRDWLAKGDFERVKVLELLLVKGWANKDVAKELRLTEQQIANLRFGAVKKLSDHIKAAGLPVHVFPELHAEDHA